MRIILRGDALPQQLNFGCGTKIKEGWFNLDAKIDTTYLETLTRDLISTWVVEGLVKSPHALPNNHFKEILAEMVFEHIHPDNIPNTLYCLYHALAPGGILTIIVPNFLRLAKKLTEIGDLDNLENRNMLRNINNEMLDPTFEDMGFLHGHKSIWVPFMAKHWLTSEGYILPHITSFGPNDFYLKICSSKPEENTYGSPTTE